MRISNLFLSPEVIDELAWKYGVEPREVEEVLFGRPSCRRIQKGHVPGEDLYVAFGQTEAGRYLSVFLFFIYKKERQALVLSARDMDEKERRRYERR